MENFLALQDPDPTGQSGIGLGIKLVVGPDAAADPLQAGIAQAAQAAPPRRDPLILDLSGDGLLTTTAEGSGLRFDFDASGFKESAGWVDAADGLLVRDLDGSGTIDTGRELFGDQTLLPNGSLAPNGFTALASLDTNSDGKVDASDAAWGELRVWKDGNSNGSTDAGELLTLAEAGIASLNTASTTVSQAQDNGNSLTNSGTFTRADGTAGKAG